MAEVELQQIGPYLISGRLSIGSTNTTSIFYKGKQRRKEVIIQRLSAPLESPDAREAFLLRAKQLKKLKGRNTVAVLDANFDGDYGYLVLEARAGQSMRQRVTPGQRLSSDEVRRILSFISEELYYAHLRGILHSNLQPESILMSERNEALLTNFSLNLPGLTLDDEHSLIPYMAPEHLRGEPSFASDQYSLAVMAYEWLCGQRPYPAIERVALLQEQEQLPLRPLREFNESISPAVENVILKALSLDPEARYFHMHEFAQYYLNALMGLPLRIVERPPKLDVLPVLSPPPPSSQPVIHNGDAKKETTAPLNLSPLSAPSTPQITVLREKPVEQMHRPAATPVLPVEEESSKQPDAPPKRNKNISITNEVSVSSADIISPAEARLVATVAEDLRQGGVLSESLPGYEERLAQIEMAALVSRSLMRNIPAVAEAGTGTGKALDVDTPIPTLTGWKRMGDLIVGDVIFDEKGHPTCVTAAFDVMYNRKCYEVIFSDGSSLVADAEHEWASYTCTDRSRANVLQSDTYRSKNFVTSDKLVLLDQLIALSHNDDTLSRSRAVALVGGHKWSVTQEAVKVGAVNPGKRPALYPRLGLLAAVRKRLARDLIEQRRDGRAYTLVTTEQMAATLTMGSAKRANHAIAVAKTLQLPEKDLPIAPYFLGAWLGVGSSRSNQITTADPDLLTEIEKDGYVARKLQSYPYRYAIDDENRKATNRWQPGMTGRLRRLGLVLNKHIPKAYLRASEQQRRALLAGLLDTDGTVSHCGAVEFTTTRAQLAEDVYELICSLGFRPAVYLGRSRLNGKDCGPKWTLAFTTDEQVFRLERKIAAHKERLLNYSFERNHFRYVVAINEVPSRPVRCIQVDSESHLYLAGRSMIPTHNSLAYLLPIVRSGKVAIVSTANKALQEQLYYKDIPFIQKHIKEFEAALVKGVSNYVCLDRMEDERTGLQYYAKNREFQRLVNLVNDPEASFNGDFETLDFPLPADVRSRVATDSDQCAWNKCGYFADCYVRKMRERAEQAQIIVVNHTLLLLDAAMDGFLLPERDVIILDEAHHLEEEATRSFTITINPAQIQLLLAQRLLKDHSKVSLQDDTLKAATTVWARLEQTAIPAYKGRANLEEPVEEGLHLASRLADLADSLRRQKPKDMPEKEGQLYEKLIKRTQNMADNVRTVFAVENKQKWVYFIERVETAISRGGFQLQVSATPLDVTSWLKERLFEKCNVICTSATLATIGPNPLKPEEKGPNFTYFRRRVGLDPLERPDVLETILPLTFDYESNALLYLPRDLPQPVFGAGQDDYMLAIAREMYRLVKLSRGRAFLLFSSKRMLEKAYELMSPHLTFPLLKQGDMTRLELTRRFRSEEGAVLFGLKSFWEGVDIAGEALSMVVIDKLPFDPPDDPVHEARVALMKAARENWFGTLVLPQAVLRLKQGLGRLLRTRDDRGVMAILDTRLHTKGYGKLVLDALPPARRTSRIKDVERFFTDV